MNTKLTIHEYVENDIPDEVHTLFMAAFPPEERRNWDLHLNYFRNGQLKLSLLTAAETFAGFVFYWPLSEGYFIEYFAVHEHMRGTGIGSQVLHLLEQTFHKIVLETELPLTPIAARRITFYERAGFEIFPFTYKQPPYIPGGAPIDMYLLQKGWPHTPATFHQLHREIYRVVYGVSPEA